MGKNVYQEHGYKSRAHYLQSMAEDYGLELYKVVAVADLLGPNEDFDGLVNQLEDMSDEAPDEELIDDPHTIPFPKGTHLMHHHSNKEVTVERDNGGVTVYVAFVGTGRIQSIPRGALVPMEIEKPKSSTKAAVSDMSVKVKDKPTVESPFKVETRAFMQEVIPENYVLLMDLVLGEKVKFKYNPKDWGRTKMQMGNKVRSLLIKKEITETELWKKLSAEVGIDRRDETKPDHRHE